MNAGLIDKNESNLTERIWFFMLLSFGLDCFSSRLIAFGRIDDGATAYFSYISTLLLILSTLASSSYITHRIHQLQESTGRRQQFNSIILPVLFGSVILFELLSRFGILIIQNFLLLTLISVIAFFTAYKHYKEHNNHELMMKSSQEYHQRHKRMQLLITELLPSGFARASAFFSAPILFSNEISVISIFQYGLAILLFTIGRPKS